jgi:quercetin dioxygenase-like cupin family protein
MKIAVWIASFAMVAASLAVVAQTVAPQKVFENASVRVEVLTLTPGTGTGRHQSVEAEVGIVVEGTPTLDSALSHQILQPGSAYWLPGLIPMTYEMKPTVHSRCSSSS